MNEKLQISALCGGYDRQRILHDITLNIPAGKVTVLLGPNGCGKSTLLKTIGRFIRPESGKVMIDGVDLFSMPTKKLARRLAILPQSPVTPAGLTVEDMVGFDRHPYQKALGRSTREDKQAVDWVLEAASLTALRHMDVGSLSGGQRQRAWIAMTLAQKTDTILLDEPTTYLDIAYQLDVLELLQELNRKLGTTIVIVLHDINLAARFADYMVAMKDGRVMNSGMPAEVITQPVLREIYGIEAVIGQDALHHCPVMISYEKSREVAVC